MKTASCCLLVANGTTRFFYRNFNCAGLSGSRRATLNSILALTAFYINAIEPRSCNTPGITPSALATKEQRNHTGTSTHRLGRWEFPHLFFDSRLHMTPFLYKYRPKTLEEHVKKQTKPKTFIAEPFAYSVYPHLAQALNKAAVTANEIKVCTIINR